MPVKRVGLLGRECTVHQTRSAEIHSQHGTARLYFCPYVFALIGVFALIYIGVMQACCKCLAVHCDFGHPVLYCRTSLCGALKLLQCEMSNIGFHKCTPSGTG